MITGVNVFRPMVYAPLSIAPMMDKTHRHFRWFLRQLTQQTLLYTEMITPAAIIHGDRHRLLDFDPIERPLVLQLGGNDPDEMAEAIRIAEDWGYDEYNLNVGCPSGRVQQGNFGACLMAYPDRVMRLLETMHRVGSRPISIKHRIGIEGRHIKLGHYENMADFVARLQDGPAQRYIVHARIALLEGLSPRENRQIPPLCYDEVYRLKEDYPRLHIEINGGVRSHDQIAGHLRHTDGVMLGRLAYERPWLIARMDRLYYADRNATGQPSQEKYLRNPTRREVIDAWFHYILRWAKTGMNARSLVWPVLEIFAGERGSRRWKQALSQPIRKGMKTEEFLARGMQAAPAELLDLRWD